MERFTNVADYIEHHHQFQSELILLRDLLLGTELEETVKWGAPAYTLKGKNLIGLMAFKSYVGLWFHQGVYLKDDSKVLFNAQEGKTKALRQWRFEKGAEIDSDLVLRYIEEAIANQKAGKELKVERNKALIIPAELERELQNNSSLKAAFEQLTAAKQREYANYIATAKRQETRDARLEKVIPMISAGKGLNDKYR